MTRVPADSSELPWSSDLTLADATTFGPSALLGEIERHGICVRRGLAVPSTFGTLSDVQASRVEALFDESNSNGIVRGRNLQRARQAVVEDHVLQTEAGAIAHAVTSRLGPSVVVRMAYPDPARDGVQSRVAPALRPEDSAGVRGSIELGWSSRYAERVQHFVASGPDVRVALLFQPLVPQKNSGYAVIDSGGDRVFVGIDQGMPLDEDLLRPRSCAINARVEAAIGDMGPFEGLPDVVRAQLRDTCLELSQLLGEVYVEWDIGDDRLLRISFVQHAAVDLRPASIAWSRMEDVQRATAMPLGKCERIFARELQNKAWYRSECRQLGLPIHTIGYLVYGDLPEEAVDLLAADVTTDEVVVRWGWGHDWTKASIADLPSILAAGRRRNRVDLETHSCVEITEFVRWEAAASAAALANGDIVVEGYPAGTRALKDGSMPAAHALIGSTGTRVVPQTFRSVGTYDASLHRWRESECPPFELSFTEPQLAKIAGIVGALVSRFSGLRVELYTYGDEGVVVRDVAMERVELNPSAAGEVTVLSPGTVSGRAVIVRSLDEWVQLAQETNISVVDHGESGSLSASTASAVEWIESQLQVEPGIIVAAFPSLGFIPVASLAAGFVFEQGALLAHLAIVLRELGVPAIVLPGATARIADGDVVEIDTTTPRVSISSQAV